MKVKKLISAALHPKLLLLGGALLLSLNSNAHNLSEADGKFVSRVFALVYPDIVRAACRDQNPTLKKRLEDALQRSGLLDFSEKDVCADDICKSVKGAERVKLDQNTLHEMIDNFRKDQVSHHMRRSVQESEKSCAEMVDRLETVKGTKGRKMEELILEVVGISAE